MPSKHTNTNTNRRKKDRNTACTRNVVLSQAFVLHVSCDWPTHPLPPFLGSGLVQVLIRVPPPHVLEHALNGEKPPCTGTSTNEKISPWVNAVTIKREWINKSVSEPALQFEIEICTDQSYLFTKPMNTNIPGQKKQRQKYRLKETELGHDISYLHKIACCMSPAMRLHMPCRHF